MCFMDAMMKKRPADYSLWDIPELEESEFALPLSQCRRIEDPNDIGDIGDLFSVGVDLIDELPGSAR